MRMKYIFILHQKCARTNGDDSSDSNEWYIQHILYVTN